MQIDRKLFVVCKKLCMIRAQYVKVIQIHIFLSYFSLFVSNILNERPDDVTSETANVNGSASNATPDILLHFNTSDRNFENIQYKFRQPQCRPKELKHAPVTL